MSKKSSISKAAVTRLFLRTAKHPWIVSKLLKLQTEKRFYELLHPMYKTGKAGSIRQLSIRITDLCNLRCIMCGQWGESGFLHGQNLKELKQNEVSPERYKELLKDLVNHGHRPIIYLWGGEPMLYDGTLDIIDTAASLKLPTAIATNGTRTTAAAERFVDAPMFLLQTSIDGPSAEIHNRIRPMVGGDDGFAKLEEGLDAVIEAKKRKKSELPLIASLTTISKENIPYLVDIYDHFKDRADMFVFYLSWWIDEERAEAHTKDFSRRFGFEPELHKGWIGGWKSVDYEALNEQLQALADRSKKKDSPPVILIPDITEVEDLQRYYTDHSADFGFDRCVSIYQVVELDSNGDMSPCRDYHDYVVGNVKEASITDLWNSQRYKDFRRSLSKEGIMPVCTRCCGLMGY